MNNASKKYRIGVDIGGTFTDIVLIDPHGGIMVKKVSSSVDDYARAIIEALDDTIKELGIEGSAIAGFRHGTTVASNAILEQKGAKTGLITTKGFRDVLEIRNLRMPRLYDIAWQKPEPLVERFLRLVVDERVDAKGRIIRPLDPKEAEDVVEKLLAEKVEAIAVCLLNCFANPSHEQEIARIIRRLAPDLPLSVSSEVLPEIKEYERTSSTAINAYVMPVVARYLARLRAGLAASVIETPVLLMQSNGGLMGADLAARKPMNIIESGPAAGVVGAKRVAALSGINDVVTFDMGGTTAKAAMIENGAFATTLEHQVGGGILTGSRLLTGAGYLLKVPSIDLAEVGAGGGSIVRIDAGGSLVVGPDSAGALPGPLCYDMGGTEPTVTDANLILGYLNPDHLTGGSLKLNADRARKIFAERIATPLGLSLEHAAFGAHRIAAANMMRAIRAVSTERGRDPRRHALFAFGGNGPVFAAAMAKELQMSRIIVPPSPGLFSAFGLLYADVAYHVSRTYRRLLRRIDLEELDRAWTELAEEAASALLADGYKAEQTRISRLASLHYEGQSFDLTVKVDDGPISETSMTALEEAFGQEHERTYGHRAGEEEPVELTEIRLVAEVPSEQFLASAAPLAETTENSQRPARSAYFGSDTDNGPASGGWLETPVLARSDLTTPKAGPCIIEEYDATCIIPPGARAEIDRYDNIQITL